MIAVPMIVLFVAMRRRNMMKVSRDVKRRTAELVAETAPLLLDWRSQEEHFASWESRGFHLTPVHFYQPFPDTRQLGPRLWESAGAMPGVDMRKDFQLELLTRHFRPYQAECLALPTEPVEGEPSRFHLNNGNFDGHDALVYLCMLRHFAPRRVIECGSGFSTRLAVETVLRNGPTDYTCIDPYPSEAVREGLKDRLTLHAAKVEDLPLSTFDALSSGDFLFVDTSHVVKIGGDVNHLFLEVIPRLAPGVVVHVHDIFFPFEYPRPWVMEHRRFWTEQYLLQAFLAFNRGFEVLFANAFMEDLHPGAMKEAFPNSPCSGSSVWLRRK